MEFSRRSKLHLLWTIPVGFFGCFVALAIFSLTVSQANDFLFIAVASVLFLPFPIWRLYNRRKLAHVPKEQAAPKESAVSKEPKEPSVQIPTPVALFDAIRNMKSKLDLQTALLKKNKGDDLPPPEVSGSKYINPNDPKLKQHYEPFKGWRSDFKKEMGFDNDDFDDDFDDDDDDDEEYAPLPNGLEIGDVISFDYTNGTGEFGERTIILESYDGDYIDGWDLNKNDERTFRTDRISGGVTNTKTGEVFYL
jgi:lipoprotein